MQRIFFNDGKHHLRSIAQKLRDYAREEEDQAEALASRLKGLEGKTDVYVGLLRAEEIKQEIITFLDRNGLDTSEKYEEYLKQNGETKRYGYYLQHTLSDQTIFTLRSIAEDNFVHIHPARVSPNTFRVRGVVLRIAILVAYLSFRHEISPTLETLNQARYIYHMSPVKEASTVVMDLVAKIRAYE